MIDKIRDAVDKILSSLENEFLETANDNSWLDALCVRKTEITTLNALVFFAAKNSGFDEDSVRGIFFAKFEIGAIEELRLLAYEDAKKFLVDLIPKLRQPSC